MMDNMLCVEKDKINELEERIAILEEKEQETKEKEIKHMMMRIISTTPLRVVNLECGEVWCSDKVVDKIYDALKEKDLIK